MIISHRHKFVFIKTKKTSGSTLEHLLYRYLDKEIDICTGSELDDTPIMNTGGEPLNGHMSYKNILKSYDIRRDEYFFFTIERNPWAKCVSSFWWHKRKNPAVYKKKDFEDYLIHESAGILPFGWKLYTNKNKISVDEVFQYENLEFMYSYLNYKFDFNITKDELKNTRCKSGLNKTDQFCLDHFYI